MYLKKMIGKTTRQPPRGMLRKGRSELITATEMNRFRDGLSGASSSKADIGETGVIEVHAKYGR